MVYETPEAEVWEVKTEGFICESPVKTDGNPEFNGFNNEQSWSV